jgi:hypothetical protein
VDGLLRLRLQLLGGACLRLLLGEQDRPAAPLLPGQYVPPCSPLPMRRVLCVRFTSPRDWWKTVKASTGQLPWTQGHKVNKCRVTPVCTHQLCCYRSYTECLTGAAGLACSLACAQIKGRGTAQLKHTYTVHLVAQNRNAPISLPKLSAVQLHRLGPVGLPVTPATTTMAVQLWE